MPELCAPGETNLVALRCEASLRATCGEGPGPEEDGPGLGPDHKAPRTLDTGTRNAQGHQTDGGRVKRRTGAGLGIDERRACLDIGTRNAQLASPTLQSSTQIAATNECHSCP